MTGDNIYLREIEPEDVELLYDWENDPEVWRVSGTTAPFSKHMLRNYVDSVGDIFTDGQLRTIICLRSEGRPIGTMDLFEHDAVNQRAGVGILIAEEEERRNGHAREALSVMMDHAFERLMLHQLYCNIAEGNEASLKLFRNAGFRTVGLKMDWIRHRNSWENEYLLQCLSSQQRQTQVPSDG